MRETPCPPPVIRLPDTVENLSGLLIPDGRLSVQRIENGWLVCAAMMPAKLSHEGPETFLGMMGPAPDYWTYFCATVADVARTVGVLCQIARRPRQRAQEPSVLPGEGEG